MRRPIEYHETRANGRVEVAAYDLNGSVLAVNLTTETGGRFLIDDTMPGGQLLKMVGRSVSVWGMSRKEDGLEILDVKEFKVI